jgi:hypothetical protein
MQSEVMDRHGLWPRDDETRCIAMAVGRGPYFSQPRFLKYHIGTSALATISASA